MDPIVELVPDALIFDTDVRCTRDQLRALKAVGFRGGVRTVTASAAADQSDVTAAEVADFMAEGLGLMLYQRPRNPGWMPTAELGEVDASVFVAKAERAGYLAGATTWDDIEGIGGTGAATVAYANAKAAVLTAAKYGPGGYVGYEVPLTGYELRHSLVVPVYWRSASNVPDVADRGYAVVQIAENISVAGVLVDVSVARADRLGGRPAWMRDRSAAA